MMSKFMKYIPKKELSANCEIRMMECSEKMNRLADECCFNLMQNYARFRFYWKTVKEMIDSHWREHYEMMSELDYAEILWHAEYTCSQEDDAGLEDYVLVHQQALDQVECHPTEAEMEYWEH